MRRRFKRCIKARLSFSGGPHAPVNMAHSMENAGSWTVSGSKGAIEVPKNFQDLRKLGVRNIAENSAANVRFLCPTFTSSILSEQHMARRARKSKPRFGARYVFMIVKIASF